MVSDSRVFSVKSGGLTEPHMDATERASQTRRKDGKSGKMIGPYVVGRALGVGTTGRVHMAVHAQNGTKAGDCIRELAGNLE